MKRAISKSVREQAAEPLLRARKLPRGTHRNDLRQLGMGLLKLHKLGFVDTSNFLRGEEGEELSANPS